MATNAERRSSEKSLKATAEGTIRVNSVDTVTNGIEENGVCHNSQPCFSDEKSGNAHDKTPDEPAVTNGELSPSSLRRSTRICALKAAEKIKLKDSVSPLIESYASNSNDGYYSGDAENDEPERPAKKRRVASRFYLDQFDCKFGVKFVNDEVLLMSDESEISSLNDEEVEQVKKVYEKNLINQTDEQMRERAFMVKTIEEELRLEEAKLTMLKTLKKSQLVTVSQMQEANMRKLTANIAQNGSGTAYKPPVATPQGRSSFSHNAHGRGSLTAQNNARTASLAAAFMNLPPQQQQLIQQAAKNGILNSATAQILFQAQQQSQANGRLSGQQQQQLAALAQQHHSRNASSASTVRESPAQKAAAAKLKLRRELEQHLLRIPPPRPPPPDMHFIPNANQPDFCALLGLDIAVQRLLKDKNATRHVSEEPYVCEECGTDFTPVWRAIGSSEDDLHLYCETCVKASQKRKMRQEHTALLRKELERVMEKEQELEKQIAEGKYDSPSVPSTSTPRVHTPAATPPPGSHTKTASGSALHGAALKTSASTSAIAHHHNAQSSHKSNSHKRPAATPASTASASTSGAASIQNVAAAAIAAAASSTGGANLLQQQMANAAALRHMTPMLATMMANPLFSAPNMLQWPAALMQQQRGLPNLTAMAALMSAAQNVQQGNTNAVAANSLAALAAINPAVAAVMGSPQMMRQYQQAQKNFLEYAKQARK